MGRLFIIFLGLIFGISAHAQQGTTWPRALTLSGGEALTLYRPTPELLEGDVLEGRMAFSLRSSPQADPVFGALSFTSRIETDRAARMATLLDMRVDAIQFPEGETENASSLQAIMESQVPSLALELSLDEIAQSLEYYHEESAEGFNNNAPEIIFKPVKSMLVLIDGEPFYREVEDTPFQQVANTPFVLFRFTTQNTYYLYGAPHWYTATAVEGPYRYAPTVPAEVQQLETNLRNQASANNELGGEMNKNEDPVEIVVRTQPAELLQSYGSPDFKAIAGTDLLYLSNSPDDVFMHIDQQKYFVLISGRWYTSRSLEGPYSYVAPDQLPADFARIPEGTPKDAVLASVPGTSAAQRAVLENEIPQTARIDRSEATLEVSWDGSPQFEPIDNTSLELALNSSVTVIRDAQTYYALDNGVWYQSGNAFGPWSVSETRPSNLDRVPPSSPAYNTRYVYVYDYTPNYVWVGYTPGYLGSFVYGPTVVYGTGFWYRPWFGQWYYPRPFTWGFGFHYNPWAGWSFGHYHGWGWYGFNYWGPTAWCGWYGPRYYAPVVVVDRPVHGYYGPRSGMPGRQLARTSNPRSNVYAYRGDAVTRTGDGVRSLTDTRKNTAGPSRQDGVRRANSPQTKEGVSRQNVQRELPARSTAPARETEATPGSRRETSPARQDQPSRGATEPQAPQRKLPETAPTERVVPPPARPSRSTRQPVITDPDGNVYRQRDNKGNDWQQRSNRNWQPSSPPTRSAPQPVQRPQSPPVRSTPPQRQAPAPQRQSAPAPRPQARPSAPAPQARPASPPPQRSAPQRSAPSGRSASPQRGPR